MTRASAAVIALLIASPTAFAQTRTKPPAPTPHERPTINSMQPGQTSASKLVGASIEDQLGGTIGAVNDLVLDKDGKVAVVVVGLSNSLGMGQREVAIDYRSLRIKREPAATGDDTITVVVDTNLEDAPEWIQNSDAGGHNPLDKRRARVR